MEGKERGGKSKGGRRRGSLSYDIYAGNQSCLR